MENSINACFNHLDDLRLAEGYLRRQGSVLDIRITLSELTAVNGLEASPSYFMNVLVEPSRSQLALDTIERYGGTVFSTSQE